MNLEDAQKHLSELINKVIGPKIKSAVEDKTLLEEDVIKLIEEAKKYPELNEKLTQFITEGGRIKRCLILGWSGYFERDTKTIYLIFSELTPVFLFHELVHYEQHKKGMLNTYGIYMETNLLCEIEAWAAHTMFAHKYGFIEFIDFLKLLTIPEFVLFTESEKYARTCIRSRAQ